MNVTRRIFIASMVCWLLTSPLTALAGGNFTIVTQPRLGFKEGSTVYILGQPISAFLASFGPPEKITRYTYDESQSKNYTQEQFARQYLAYTESHYYFKDGLTNTRGKSGEVFTKYLRTSKGLQDHFGETQAKQFFDDFRCGILHQAEVMGPSLLWSVGLLKGEKDDGTPYINRTKFHEILKEDFNRYCDELKDPANSELRKHFRTKMDFIARKED